MIHSRERKIICATDFSEPSRYAVNYALALAKKLEAKLYLCHIIDMSYAAMYRDCIEPAELEARIMKDAREKLQALIGSEQIDWEPLISKGYPADEIARMAEEIGVDFAVTATHSRSGLKRLVLGSVTEYLIRALPCPLLVVRRPKHGLEESESLQVKVDRILVGCDFSPHSILSFLYGLAIARAYQCELHLAHVVESSRYTQILKSVSEETPEQVKDLHRGLEDKLKKMIPVDAQTFCTPITKVLTGQPYEALTQYAVSHNIDLIVLGVRGQGLMGTLLLGSTTDRVIREAPCPVLSVQPTIQNPVPL